MLIHLHIPDQDYLTQAAKIIRWVGGQLDEPEDQQKAKELATLYDMYSVDPESKYPIDLPFNPFTGNAVNEYLQGVKLFPPSIDLEVFKSLATQFKSNYTMPEITILPEEIKPLEIGPEVIIEGKKES